MYNAAYLEISDMLNGEKLLSIKRAVFLAEWAYLNGQLNYEEYCKSIDSVANFLKRFIKANELEKYKTGKNMALIEYFFRPYSGNRHKPFTYDFDDTEGVEDFTNQFVTKVMRTHNGQCRSLPMYYKVLAEAINAKAYISYAPQHVFIRYRDEDNLFPEDWVNVELTTHQLTPEFWIKENFEISTKTIESKIYLHPLTDKETVASQLADLAFGYWNKYRVYDDFTWLCATKSLEYYPQNPKALIIQRNSLHKVFMKHLERNGYERDRYALLLEGKLKEISNQLKSLGWEEMSDELFDKLEKGKEQAKIRESAQKQ